MHKLKKLCAENRWDRYDLLEIVPSVSKSTIDNWLKGKSRPNLDAALRIAREFGVSLEWLADDEMKDQPAPEISDREREILRIVRRIGVEDAESRLLGVEKQPTAPAARPPAEIKLVGRPRMLPGPNSRESKKTRKPG